MHSTEPRKILVVDDEPLIRELCSEILAPLGCRVETAPNAIKALEKIADARYDLVVSDIKMPGLDGVDLYLTALEEHDYLADRFLFISGSPSDEDGRIIIRKLGRQILKKPFTPGQLRDRVKEFLAVLVADSLNYKGAMKRTAKRVDWVSGCQIFEDPTFDSAPLTSWTHDISRSGLGTWHVGKTLEHGSAVGVCFDGADMKLRASVAWSRSVEDQGVASGLFFDSPAKIASIIGSAKIPGR